MKIEMGMRRAARFAMMAALAMAPVAFAQTVTHTTLTAETQDTGGKTVATLAASVVDAGGSPVSGTVTLVDGVRAISSAALDSDGKATIKLDSLTAGDHAIKAVYNGTSGADAHLASTSEAVTVHPLVPAPAPDFGLTLDSTTLSLAVGKSGTIKATATPENGFTGFISFSCAGPAGATTLPYGITCSFAPANVQVTNGAQSVEMTVQTSPGLSLNTAPKGFGDHSSPLVLAVLFPGVIGLGLLGRRRNRLGQLVLLAVMAGAVLAGTTACNPRYYYLNHGPTYPGATPGNYTLQVIAQTSNGVTASTHATNLALTVTAATSTTSK
ncbi:MAG TPA: Ig-like domain-containing protein [Acidobacteriaceae bacterium]|nr:Ig-like domain-containing protein [Acidobacteriaceae bacterium]